MLPKIGNKTVLAYAQTEVQSTGPCGIVLVEVKPGIEWVTAWHRIGEREWCYGHYFFNEQDAYKDFVTRVTENLPRFANPVTH